MKERARQVLAEVDGGKTALGVALALVGAGVWWGNFQASGILVDVTEIQAFQAAFQDDEEAFRETVMDEVQIGRESRIRNACRIDQMRRLERDSAGALCFGSNERKVPLQRLVDMGY